MVGQYMSVRRLRRSPVLAAVQQQTQQNQWLSGQGGDATPNKTAVGKGGGGACGRRVMCVWRHTPAHFQLLS